ncbi:hypothetical protein [Shewanella baltica]|uniref:hypothetical protein n=1 Tax=Shewanella baltica TaxID=62322 RepID=UPI00217CE7C4|nr:hypothetical protein [Shewanella baltica]MCS6173223.1 hypothetical protein [Shewanella baltica]
MKIFSNVYFNTVLIWIALIIIAFVEMNIYTISALFIYTGYVPHINILLWLSFSEVGKKIKEKVKLQHWAVIISYLLFVYSLYAQSWAASLINEIFHIDPAKFGITESFLIVLIAPVSLLYYPDHLAIINTGTVLASMLIAPILVLGLIAGFAAKKVFKAIGIVLLVTFLMSFFSTLMFKFTLHTKDVAEKFALNTDFNTVHMCKNSWVNEATSLVFLGGSKVLVYSKNKPEGARYKVQTCDFAKSF